MTAITPDPAALAAATGIDLQSAERVLTWLGVSAASVIAEQSAANTFVFDQDDPPQPQPDVQVLTPDQRYEDQGLLGRGGMGEVRRVYDRQLNRSIAMKILRKNSHRAVNRFLGEARVIAGLQHPGVLPVHEIGRLPDGRVYFTMQEIRGQTLRHHVREVHHAADNHWRATADGWTFRRLIAAFHAACGTVAYSHGEGMVHRDLKPQNIMVGAHDEVLVVDWGLARAVGSPGVPGRIVGTPAYLAPELLHTECPPVDPRADVYALGAVLYVILTNRSPFHGTDAQAIIEAVRQGPSPVPQAGLPLPDELIELCVRAMARDPNTRIGHAGVLAVAVRTWLDGAHQREQAQALVTQARATLPEAAALRARAAALESQVRDELSALPAWAPEQEKHAAWAVLDEAASLRERAAAREDQAELELQGALTVDPTLPDAHAELATRSMARHAQAEAAHDTGAAARALVRLRRHLDNLPPHHPARSRLRTYLRGDGALTLHTKPSGAQVKLLRVVERQRRLVAEPAGSLGRTPLDAAALPHGDLLLEILRDGHSRTLLPLRIPRGGHWSRMRHGAEDPDPLVLPAKGDLGVDECYVPGGWTTVGGDPDAVGSASRRRLWVDGFAMRRFPVTNREYVAFLDDLVDRGQVDLALRLAPRERGGMPGVPGPMIYGRSDDGRSDDGHFSLAVDRHGTLWQPEWPVILVDCFGAQAFAAWEGGRTGQAWRLPSEWEWEKAARGVDERPYPWGRHFDPSRACTRLSHRGRPQPAPVDSFPTDQSLYGVRGLAGNVRDWCADVYQEIPPPDGARLSPPPTANDDEPRINRGGFWLGNERNARSADRHFHPPDHRSAELGFRLARTWPPAAVSPGLETE